MKRLLVNQLAGTVPVVVALMVAACGGASEAGLFDEEGTSRASRETPDDSQASTGGDSPADTQTGGGGSSDVGSTGLPTVDPSETDPAADTPQPPVVDAGVNPEPTPGVEPEPEPDPDPEPDPGPEPDPDPEPDPPITPIAHWSLDGSASDIAGSFDGRAMEVSYRRPEGVRGQAATFPDDDSRISIDAFTETFYSIQDEFSLYVRVWFDDDNGEQTFFGLGDYSERFAGNQWSFQLGNGRVELKTETGEGEDHVADLGPAPPTRQWVTLLFSVKGNAVAYYLNGMLVTHAGFVPAESGSNTLSLGGFAKAGQELDGYLDDVRVYDVAIMADQFERLDPPL